MDVAGDRRGPSEQCLTDPALEGCTPLDELPAPEGSTNDAGGGQDEASGGDEGAAGGDVEPDGGTAGGGTEGRAPVGLEAAGPSSADGSTYTPGGWIAGSGSAAALAIVCDDDPATLLPACPAGGEEPTPPLTCEDLAELLGQEGCPENFTCEELAELFGLAGCPEGPPTCEDLAGLFGLENCEQIPCLDTSQVPADAKAGLTPLLDGLKQIGVEQCAEETPTGGGQKPPANSNNPPPTVQGTYYANCDDARARGAAPVNAGQPGYRAGLDSDNDGIGCEDDGPAVTPATAQTYQTGTLAYTGIELEPMLRGIAILISSGTLLLLAGLRRT